MRVAVRLLVSLLVAAAVAEAAALVIHYVDTGWFFYQNPHRVQRPVPAADGEALTGDALSPYFGPTHRPGLPFTVPADLRPDGAPPAELRTNNYGFVATANYPVRRANDRQFLVGLFGGSVGNWFCHAGAPRLVARLERAPALAGREIVPLCFAHEGYKQPQQVLVLAYFLSLGQPFDLVINIDGFNEVALGGMNDQRGYAFSMPSVAHLDPMVNLINRGTLTPEKAELLGEISRERAALARWARRVNGARLAVTYVVADRLYAILAKRYQAALVRFNALPSVGVEGSLVRIAPREGPAGGDALYAGIAREWAEASGEMQALLAPRGIPYVHVLQPNQYASTRAFSAAERQTAFIEGSPFKPGAEQGYPHLLAEPAQRILRERGVRFVDGTHAFDRTAAPVYWDNCCHYTRLGNEVLADLIAGAVLAPGVLSRH